MNHRADLDGWSCDAQSTRRELHDVCVRIGSTPVHSDKVQRARHSVLRADVEDGRAPEGCTVRSRQWAGKIESP